MLIDWGKLVDWSQFKPKVTKLRKEIWKRCKAEKCDVVMPTFLNKTIGKNLNNDEITIRFNNEEAMKKHKPEDYFDIKGIYDKPTIEGWGKPEDYDYDYSSDQDPVVAKAR